MCEHDHQMTGLDRPLPVKLAYTLAAVGCPTMLLGLGLRVEALFVGGMCALGFSIAIFSVMMVRSIWYD